MAASSTALAPERSKVEQIVVEFFAKSLQIILESRIPALGGEGDYLGSSASSSTSGPKTRDRWFNLALGDCTAALENFEPWRRNLSEPMVVDIVLDHPKQAKGSTPAEQGSSTQATVLERWIVHFEQGRISSPSRLSRRPSGAKVGFVRDDKSGTDRAHELHNFFKEELSGSGSGSMARIGSGQIAGKGGLVLPAHVTDVSAIYKRIVIMLRSLYSMCRLLPAYRLFKISSSPMNCCDFTLDYTMLSSAAPLSGHERQDMSVETVFGRMCLSVAYRPTTSVITLEVVPSILPRIIPDYVGSPTTNPLKRFTVEPHSLPISGTSITQGMRMVSVPSSLQDSPPGFERRHSWSGRINQVKPVLQPPSSPSYRTNPHSRISTEPISIDNRFSPPFSPSPSPSPPTLYRESDPVSIPQSHLRGSKLLTGDAHQRSRNLLPPRSPSSRKAGLLRRSSSESPRYSGQSVSHAHQSRSFESPMHLHVLHDDRGQQVWMHERAGPLSTDNFLYGQSQTTLSRSSSRTALAEEGEDEDFSCPFAVDDMDAEEKRSRLGSSGLMGEGAESSMSSRGSHDAAVGALILSLKSAPPLTGYLRVATPFTFGASHERESLSDRSPASLAVGGRPPSLLLEPVPTARTVAEALEELRYYKERVHTSAAEEARVA